VSPTSGTYVVFARRQSQEPLTRIGTVTVKEGASVADSVTLAHGKDWIELVAIPDTAMGWAIGGGDEAS
jgi:hypothetical protein